MTSLKKEDVNDVVFDYFDEISPAIVNFLVQCQRECSRLNFDRVVFYYMPGYSASGFPYVVIFFNGNVNVTNDIVAGNNTFSTMLKIFENLHSVFSPDQLEALPEFVLHRAESLGIEEYLFEIFSAELRDVVERGKFDAPTIATQLHDSNEELKLNERG